MYAVGLWEARSCDLIRRSNFCKDHRDKKKVPDPLVVEDLISDKLNNRRKLAKLTKQYSQLAVYTHDLGRVYRPHCVRSVLTTSVKILPYRPPARLIRAKYFPIQ